VEELNKTQIILLTLFITFVTAVTTGIVAVTLLQQAPPAVTQTINRVVEKTIEKVTPIKTEIKETRVVLDQEDAIIKTAAAAKPTIVRIVLPEDFVIANADAGVEANDALQNIQAAVVNSGDANREREIGTGFLVSSDGMVATAYPVIPDQNVKYGVFVGDKKYVASVLVHSRNDGLTLLKINNDGNLKFSTTQIASKPVVLGQTVIVLGRDLSRYTISVGLVSSLREAVGSSLPVFKTTVKPDDTNIGGPLLDSGGSVIGLNLSGGNSVPIELVKQRLNSSNGTTTKSNT